MAPVSLWSNNLLRCCSSQNNSGDSDNGDSESSDRDGCESDTSDSDSKLVIMKIVEAQARRWSNKLFRVAVISSQNNSGDIDNSDSYSSDSTCCDSDTSNSDKTLEIVTIVTDPVSWWSNYLLRVAALSAQIASGDSDISDSDCSHSDTGDSDNNSSDTDNSDGSCNLMVQ